MFKQSTVVAALTLSTLAAQSVGVSLTALAPLPIQLSSSTANATNSWPAGVMGNHGSFCTSLPGAGNLGGCFSWNAYTNSYAVTVTLLHELGNQQQLPGFTGQLGPHEILMEFSSNIARTAKLQLNRSVFVAPGGSWPIVNVDIDNDGVFEITNLSTLTAAPISVTFGPQPLLVRVAIDVTLGAQASVSNYVSVVLLPDNNLTITQPIAGCSPASPAPPPFLLPSFDNTGVQLSGGQDPNQPSLMILSLTAQPALLSMNGAAPCILLPTPDVVLFVPSGLLNIPLPASVRPVTFFAQGVTLTPSGLRATDGFAVTAN
ncbi:MAG: hypothetical protein ACI89X_001931 [Planctomycetota bacterium]|jgi:hypothetical protein